MRRIVLLVAFVSILEASSTSRAQWPNYRAAHIPRLADDRPDPAALSPRAADGRPDLPGVWESSLGLSHSLNIAADLKPDEVAGRAEALLNAQETAPAEFEATSIKRNTSGTDISSMRTLPDGTFVMVNQSIRSIIMSAAPVRVRDVVGLPGWVSTERYDIVAKPPPGATPEQRSEMFRRMFADRLQLRSHVEERQQTTFSLVVDRADGRLGPALAASTLDCTQRFPPQAFVSVANSKNRCGISSTSGLLVSGGATMEAVALSITGASGRIVNDRTGLKGAYAFALRYTPRPDIGPSSADDAPELATALREQLGLRLHPERGAVPTLVVESIARPSEN